MIENNIKFTDIQIIFSKIQENPALFDVKIDHYSLWAIIKVPLHNILSQWLAERSITINSSFESKVNILRYIYNCLVAKVEWFFHVSLRRSKTKHLVLLNLQGSKRYLTSDGNYKEPFGDNIYLSTKRKFDVFVIEKNKGVKRHKNVKCKVHIREDLTKCPNLIGLRWNKSKNEELQIAKLKLLNILKIELKNYPVLFDKIVEEFDKIYLNYKVRSFFNEKRIAKKLLRRLTPKIVIITSSEGYYGLIAAAKEIEIPVIEFQHGVQDKYHPQYNWPEFLKNRKHELMIPDSMFLFGAYWKEILLKHRFWKKKELLPIGLSYIDDITNNTKKKNFGIAVYVYTSNIVVRPKALAFFKEVLIIAKKMKLGIRINVKLHPSEDSEYMHYLKLQKEFPAYFKVYYHSEKGLFEHFAESDVHLSTYSASIFESLAIGTPTALLDFGGKEFFGDLIDKGVVKFFKDPAILIENAKQVMNRSNMWDEWVISTSKSSDYFYKKYSLSEIIGYLNKMLY
jgi:hypothetical protein